MSSCEEHFAKQTKWHEKSLQGCIYAAILIGKDLPDSYVKKVCYLEVLNESLISKISTDINAAIADAEVYAVRFLLPQLTTKEHLLKFIELSKEHTNWVIDDTEVYNNLRLVKYRVSLLGEKDENDVEIFSWALGFGPFKFYPDTRQSPYFEFMLPVKSRQFFKKKFDKHSLTQHTKDTANRGGDSFDAHLADIYMKGYTDNPERDNQLWESSHNRKEALLTRGGTVPFDDNAAKAKITFSYEA